MAKVDPAQESVYCSRIIKMPVMSSGTAGSPGFGVSQLPSVSALSARCQCRGRAAEPSLTAGARGQRGRMEQGTARLRGVGRHEGSRHGPEQAPSASSPCW